MSKYIKWMTEQSASLVEHMPIGWTDLRGLRSAPEQDVLPAPIPGHQEGEQTMIPWRSVQGSSTLVLFFCSLSMRYQASGVSAGSIKANSVTSQWVHLPLGHSGTCSAGSNSLGTSGLSPEQHPLNHYEWAALILLGSLHNTRHTEKELLCKITHVLHWLLGLPTWFSLLLKAERANQKPKQ